MKWRDKRWFLGLIVVPLAAPVVAWMLAKSPNQNPIVNNSNLGIGTQNQSGGKNVFNTIQEFHRFSETQSIRILPKNLGGNRTLNLDNVAMLRAGRYTNTGEITLFLDTPAIGLPDIQGRGFSAPLPNTKIGDGTTGMIEMFVKGTSPSDISISDVTISPHLGKSYVFDLARNHRQEIAVAGRAFIVTLTDYKKLAVPSIPAASEYVFAISEK